MSVIINDDNWQQVVEESATLGHPPGIAPDMLSFRADPIGTYSGVYADAFPLIDESEWIERIKFVTASGGFIGQRWQPDPQASYQNGYGWCWAYSLAQAVMGARAKADMEFALLSPESLLECVKYQNRGYYCDRALDYAKQHGIAERRLVPQYSRDSSKWGDYRDNALGYRPDETWDGGARNMWAETVTALLCGDGCYCGYNRFGHAIWLDGLVLDGNKIGAHSPNTHGPGKDWTLWGSVAVPDEMFVIRSTTYQ